MGTTTGRAGARPPATGSATGSAARVPSVAPGPLVLAALMSQRMLPTDLLTRAARRHPRMTMVKLANVRMYAISDPELARQVVVGESRHLRKGRGLQRAQVLLGTGLLTSEGEVWRRQRRLVQPAFHRDRVRGYADQMVEAAARTSSRWRPHQVIDVGAEMSALTLDVVGRTLFGEDLAGEAVRVRQALDDVMARSRTLIIPGSQVLDRLPLPSVRRAQRAMERLDEVVAGVVERHRSSGGADRDDVLAMLLAARDDDGDGTGMSATQVRDEVMTLLLAGHETTAMALTWTWWLLARHGDVAADLRAELARVLGGRDPSYDDLPDLALTRAVVAESMRLYPPAWVFGRQLLDDLEVDGARLRAGSVVLVSAWVLHRDARWWSEPEHFRPRRWLDAAGRFDEEAPGQPRDAYVPFGMGQRICVGRDFAWTEAVLVLATLAQRWALDVPTTYDAAVRPVITLRPATAMPATLSPA